ncbi:MAG TPA: DUF2249 domain-containing protein [Ramlibacter sp.]|nr:DUF2249 domain-containing protein [Ramlibacter sp.]
MTTATATTRIDVRQLACEQRFALIFSTFGDLPAGQAIELVNDHDPKPLRNVFDARHPGNYAWDYLEQGPEVWRVAITKTRAAKAHSDGQCCGSCGGQ